MIHFRYIFCVLVWGLNFIAVKIQGCPVNLEVSLAYRLAGTAIIFTTLALISKPKGLPTLNDSGSLLVFGVCNFALSYLCLYYSTIWISAALVTLIFSLKTVLTPIALYISIGERLNRRVLIGGILGIIGVSLLIYPKINVGVNKNDIIGISIAFLGTLITSVGDITSAKNARKKINPIYSNSIGFAVAALLMFVICMVQGRNFTMPMSTSYIGSLVFLMVFASFFAWLYYLKLIEQIGAASSSYMVALFPVVGGIASVIIGDSEPTRYLLFGCLLSCLGAAIALGVKLSPQLSK